MFIRSPYKRLKAQASYVRGVIAGIEAHHIRDGHPEIGRVTVQISRDDLCKQDIDFSPDEVRLMYVAAFGASLRSVPVLRSMSEKLAEAGLFPSVQPDDVLGCVN